MTIQLDIDTNVMAVIDEAISVLKEDRDDVFRQTFLELAKKKKREAEVAKQYAEAYGKQPVQPDEFEIDEAQITEVWDQMEAEEK